MLEFERLAPVELQKLVVKVAMNDNYITPKTVLKTEGLRFDNHAISYSTFQLADFVTRLDKGTRFAIMFYNLGNSDPSAIIYYCAKLIAR